MTRLIVRTGLVAGLALGFQIAFAQTQLAQQPAPAAAGGQQAGRGGGQRGAVDPRVQQRVYVFNRTGLRSPQSLLQHSA